MKKKILLIATMIMLFAFVLSISVFAYAYEENRTTIEYNGQSVSVITSDATVDEVAKALGNNATMQGLFKDDNALVILADNNGNLFAFPTWYIIEPKDYNPSYAAISEVEYTFVNTLVEGSTFAKGAVRYIEFPHGMTAVRNNNVFGNRDFYEVNVTDVHIPSTVNSIEGGAFGSAPKLKNVYIEKGNGITAISGGTFSNSSVEYVQFENLTELVSIDGFSNTKLSCDVDLSNSKLKTIVSGTFKDSTGINKISLPDTVESIGEGAFQNIGSGYLASPYLPKNLTFIGKWFFAYNDNLLETYIFPAGVKALADEPFQNSKVGGGPAGKELNLVFLGEVTGIVYLNGGGHQKHAENVTVYFAQNSLDQYNKNGFKIKPSTNSVLSVPEAIKAVFCKGIGAGTNGNVTGVEYAYITNMDGTSYTSDYVNHADYGFDFENHTHFGALTRVENNCAVDGSETIACIVCDRDIVTHLAATGKHNYVQGQCTVCGKFYCTSGGDHIIKVEAVYANGFASAGVVVNKCQSEGCTHEEKIRDIGALFTCLGYSAPEDGRGGIAIGFIVNNVAIAEYEEITGKTLKCGVFAVVKDKLGDNDVFAEDGTVADGVINADIADEFVAFELKIEGFTDKYKATKLAIGAYVAVTEDEATEYFYMQSGTPLENEKYCFVSYNDIVGAPSTDEENAQ